MTRTLTLASSSLPWLLGAALAGACTAGGSTFEEDDNGVSAGSSGSTSVTGDFSSSVGTGGPAPDVALLQGTVRAPEGTIPISGALVYLTKDDPAPIPQGVFCDKCIELPADAPYALTEPNGSFSLGVPSIGSWQLVVQKGAFRKVRSIEVTAGPQGLPPDLTTLPKASNPAAGDDIPRMAVALGNYDDIQNTLGKLGLGQVDSFGELVDGTAQFDILEEDSRTSLLTNYDVLAQYHIVFFPCASSWPDTHLTNPAVLENLRNYMAAGGRIYATDYTYDVLRQAFAEPIKWLDDNGSMGSAESFIWSAPATADDPGLAAWLAAQSINAFTVEDNWTVVSQVVPYSAPGPDGAAESFEPKVWVSAQVPGVGVRPSTVSYQYGCGRALFSTYHTESGGGSGLLTQERALLYTVLEVGVCIGEVGPPK